MNDLNTKTLKPGDEVAICTGGYGKSTYTLAAVERVTPSGQVVLTNGRRFTDRCREIGSSGYHAPRLWPVTDAVRESIRHDAAVQRIWRRMEKWEQLPADAMEAIEAILDRQPAESEE